MPIGDAYGSVHLQNMSGAAGRRAARPLGCSRAGRCSTWPLAAGTSAAAWRPSFEPETGVVTVWDLDTGAQRFPPVTVDFRIGDVAIAADGSTVVVSGGEQGRVLIRTGPPARVRSELPTLVRPDDAINFVVTAALDFLPDGRFVVGSQAGPIRIVDPASGAEVGRFGSRTGNLRHRGSVSDDGRTMVTAGYR